MTLLTIVIVLVVISLSVYAVQSFLPGPPAVKNIICGVLVLIAILWLLGAFGLLPFGYVHAA
jgi:hypothetical protein